MVSIFDLLRRFDTGDKQSGGLSRLADLHLKVGGPARFRHDGQLVALEGAADLTPEVARGLVYPLLRPDHIRKLEQDLPEDVDAGFHFDDEGLDFRINVFHDRDGLAMVVRALPRDVPETRVLGFPDPHVVQEILDLRQGLVVVTGITGSGKSTTIASILAEINRRHRMRVITLEDPIEYVMSPDKCLISQREVGKNTRTFAGGLRSALREDPDIIFLGEIRDSETANLALAAAETGHLVFTTLHTRDAKGVVTRIVDLFPPERSKEVMSQLSFSLAYVVAQKLLPRKDGKGRVATFEILKNIPSVSNLIRTGAWHQIYATMQLSAKDHMLTLEKHLMSLVAKGLVSTEIAMQYANDPSQLTTGISGPVATRRPKV
jgi:twitching motility protein PilT